MHDVSILGPFWMEVTSGSKNQSMLSYSLTSLNSQGELLLQQLKSLCAKVLLFVNMRQLWWIPVDLQWLQSCNWELLSKSARTIIGRTWYWWIWWLTTHGFADFAGWPYSRYINDVLQLLQHASIAWTYLSRWIYYSDRSTSNITSQALFVLSVLWPMTVKCMA